MQVLITTSVFRRPWVMQFTPMTLALTAMVLMVPVMLLSVLIYHAVLFKAAREQWPVVSEVVRFVEERDASRRDRYMRENLNAMAERVGDLQARLMRLEAVGERVAGMAGLKPEEFKQIEAAAVTPSPAASAASDAKGGPLLPVHGADSPSALTVQALQAQMEALQLHQEAHGDIWTLIESRLSEKRLQALMVPSSSPIQGVVGSGFGIRSDPFVGRPALHTGLDFPAATGTPIHAAAGGVVRSAAMHHEYGQLIEVDHGNGLVTRYAHTSRMHVKAGDLVKRGQKIAEVGTTGRSTGPHLHFEVLLDGVHQNPSRFLTALNKR